MIAGVAAAVIISAVCLFAAAGKGQALPWVGSSAPQAPGLAQPALTFKDCQRIKLCSGGRCAPRWRCRECDYKRVCRQGRCEWIDVCVWGPYRLVLPQGAFPG